MLKIALKTTKNKQIKQGLQIQKVMEGFTRIG